MSHICVVFNGYDCEPPTRDREHKRQAGKVSMLSSEVNIELVIAHDQDAILANSVKLLRY